jgi:hypothetical protein
MMIGLNLFPPPPRPRKRCRRPTRAAPHPRTRHPANPPLQMSWDCTFRTWPMADRLRLTAARSARPTARPAPRPPPPPPPPAARAGGAPRGGPSSWRPPPRPALGLGTSVGYKATSRSVGPWLVMYAERHPCSIHFQTFAAVQPRPAKKQTPFPHLHGAGRVLEGVAVHQTRRHLEAREPLRRREARVRAPRRAADDRRGDEQAVQVFVGEGRPGARACTRPRLRRGCASV